MSRTQQTNTQTFSVTHTPSKPNKRTRKDKTVVTWANATAEAKNRGNRAKFAHINTNKDNEKEGTNTLPNTTQNVLNACPQHQTKNNRHRCIYVPQQES